ncbi:MAG: hypothetical protein HKO89_06770 [Saprospiraceae bacterium]|nr:hypothetical protein [Bacteroidia bacterium]NNK90296.1 hypothetical protein [Saprospiraceae bacterium]
MATHNIYVRMHSTDHAHVDLKNESTGTWKTEHPEQFVTVNLVRGDTITWKPDGNIILKGIKRYSSGANASDPDIIGPTGRGATDGPLATLNNGELSSTVLLNSATADEHYIIVYADSANPSVLIEEDPKLRMNT